MCTFVLSQIFLNSINVANTCFLFSFAGKETLRCLALALKQMPMGQQTISYDDEKDLTFIGLVCFLSRLRKLGLFSVYINRWHPS